MTDKSARETLIEVMRGLGFDFDTPEAQAAFDMLDVAGFVVAPKVPTEAMLLAMHDGPLGADNEMGPHQRAWLREMYEAALAASNPKEEGK